MYLYKSLFQQSEFAYQPQLVNHRVLEAEDQSGLLNAPRTPPVTFIFDPRIDVPPCVSNNPMNHQLEKYSCLKSSWLIFVGVFPQDGWTYEKKTILWFQTGTF